MTTEAPILSLQGFGVGFHERVVLADVTLDVPTRGVMILMGPAGGGKSALMRTLCGMSQSTPAVRLWGSALFQGLRVEGDNRPVLVQQDARYFVSTVRENLVSRLPHRHRLERAQQTARLEELLEASGVPELAEHFDSDALSLSPTLRRLLSVLRAMVSDAPLVCLDESTANLEPEGAARVLEVIRWYARAHAVLFATHHQLHAKAVGDRCALLAGGRVQEVASLQDFFQSPSSPVTRHFLETGSVSLPSPDANPEHLADDAPRPPPLPPAARAAAPSAAGPRGFRWLVAGRLGGLPRPGIIAALDEDLAALRRVGITTLVTLEETPTVPRAALEGAGIESLHFPIPDMQAPQAVPAAAFCRRVAQLLADGAVVAYHCRAGQGRTGTMLACQLIWTGLSAMSALDSVRAIEPKWVTSDAQVRFLETFADFVGWHDGHRAQETPPESRWHSRKTTSSS